MKEALSKVLKTGLTVLLSILEVKNIQICNDNLISTFTNFPQYCSISFNIYDYICSIVYPRNVEIDIDINKKRENSYKTLKISTFREIYIEIIIHHKILGIIRGNKIKLLFIYL